MKNTNERFYNKTDPKQNAHVIFRQLGDRCSPIASNLYGPLCWDRSNERAIDAVTWTKSGKSCMPWKAYGKHGSSGSTCITSKRSGPWCYANLMKKKEKCFVPKCDEITSRCYTIPAMVEQTNFSKPICNDEEDVFFVNIASPASM